MNTSKDESSSGLSKRERKYLNKRIQAVINRPRKQNLRQAQEIKAERDALLKERDELSKKCNSLEQKLKNADLPDERSKKTYLRIIGALLKTITHAPNMNQDRIISDIIEEYRDLRGMS